MNILEEMYGRGAGTIVGIIIGGAVTWSLARWQRMRERQKVLRGDARDTVVIHHHLIETTEFTDPQDPTKKRRLPTVMRIRSLGQGPLSRVVPNIHLSDVFLARANQVTLRDTLISMDGAEGSYLLETLTGYVCDRIANTPFEHDYYVMAPCCEPKELAHFQPITILLIAVKDLALFESWPDCRNVQVEHGGDGARILTLMNMAQRHRAEQEKLAHLREEGRRTKFVETMYVLDLCVDKRTAPLPLSVWRKKRPPGTRERCMSARNSGVMSRRWTWRGS
jgi:hypothetical protein